jgi:DNA-binding NarL/FixJ family response regulator
MSDKIQVLIVDDHPVVRGGLRHLLSHAPDIEVIGEADTGEAAIGANRQLHPDVIVLDIRMPGIGGLQCIPSLREDNDEVKILVLTSYDSDEYLFGALGAGAHGFLLKSSAYSELIDAVRDIFSGKRQLSPPLMGRVLTEFEVYAREISRYKIGLSQDHIKILRLVAEGLTNREIAGRLHWSEITVKRKISEILVALGVGTRAQAASEAVKRGMI